MAYRKTMAFRGLNITNAYIAPISESFNHISQRFASQFGAWVSKDARDAGEQPLVQFQQAELRGADAVAVEGMKAKDAAYAAAAQVVEDDKPGNMRHPLAVLLDGATPLLEPGQSPAKPVRPKVRQ